MAKSKQPEAPVKLTNPFDEHVEDKPDALIYGASGTGKTGLASTAPKPLIIDLENGAPITVRAVGNPDARVVTADDMGTIREIYAWLRNEDHGFETVVIDPLGELQTMLMIDTLERYPAKRSFNRVPSMQDWGLATEDFKKLFNAFRSLDMHVVFIAHAQSRHNDEDMVEPMLQGARMKNYAMRQVDLLAYLRMSLDEDEEEATRTLLTAGTEYITAKNRGGYLEPLITNPNLSDIFKAMTQTTEKE